MSYLPRHLEGERGARPGYISEYMRKLILIALEHEFVEGVSSAVLDYKGNGSYSEIPSRAEFERRTELPVGLNVFPTR